MTRSKPIACILEIGPIIEELLVHLGLRGLATGSNEILNQSCRFCGRLDQQGMGGTGHPGKFDGFAVRTSRNELHGQVWQRSFDRCLGGIRIEVFPPAFDQLQFFEVVEVLQYADVLVGQWQAAEGQLFDLR